MAKKNYQQLNCEWIAGVTENKEKVNIRMKCLNSKGTEVETTLKIDLWQLPGLVAEFNRISKQRMKNAQEFHARLKEALA